GGRELDTVSVMRLRGRSVTYFMNTGRMPSCQPMPAAGEEPRTVPFSGARRHPHATRRDFLGLRYRALCKVSVSAVFARDHGTSRAPAAKDRAIPGPETAITRRHSARVPSSLSGTARHGAWLPTFGLLDYRRS